MYIDSSFNDESQDRIAERQYDFAQRLKARSKRRLSNVMKQKEERLNRLSEKENSITNERAVTKSAKKKQRNRRWSDFPLTPGMVEKLPVATKQILSRSGKKARFAYRPAMETLTTKPTQALNVMKITAKGTHVLICITFHWQKGTS